MPNSFIICEQVKYLRKVGYYNVRFGKVISTRRFNNSIATSGFKSNNTSTFDAPVFSNLRPFFYY